MGRYSFRRDGRWIGEDSCDPATAVPPTLWLTEDSTDGPKPPANFEFDSAVLNKKFAALTRHTSASGLAIRSMIAGRWSMDGWFPEPPVRATPPRKLPPNWSSAAMGSWFS